MKLANLVCITALLGLGLGGTAQAANKAGAPIDAETCKAAWTLASPNGDTISQGEAVPYVVNFSMVDTDGDGKISADEFSKGCKQGLIKADSTTAKEME
jgi:hypothetical protein